MGSLSEAITIKRIRICIVLFMVGMIGAGLTAFPIETLLAWTVEHTGFLPQFLSAWIEEVYLAIRATNESYPYLAYGTDWLAFAHLVIAVAFFGPLKDPVKNIWVIQFGLISCVMVFPLALIAGYIREVPFYWRLIDCSLGLIGFILLWYCYRMIKRLADGSGIQQSQSE